MACAASVLYLLCNACFDFSFSGLGALGDCFDGFSGADIPSSLAATATAGRYCIWLEKMAGFLMTNERQQCEFE